MTEERKTLDERAQMTDLERLRHSASHVLATAILKIWPEAQFAAGGQQRRRLRGQRHARSPAMALGSEPPRRHAARQCLARRLRLVVQRAERVDQRLLPDALGRREHELPEQRQEHRAGGRSTDGPASKLIVHDPAAYRGLRSEITDTM